jgi:hypothetical protein
MDANSADTDMLIPPSTDFARETISSAPRTDLIGPRPGDENSEVRNGQGHEASNSAPSSQAAMISEIAQEVEWKGLFLRKIRESRKISIEEMAESTKITKSYLTAIEEENFLKLPAAVYLRGFVMQIAKILRLPHEKVATAYMARYYEAQKAKTR